jgi:two-component system response regulator HydG
MRSESPPRELRLRAVILGSPENTQAFSSHISDSLACDVFPAATEQEALDLVEREPSDVLMADLETLGEGAEEFARAARRRSARLQLLLITPAERVADALKAMRAGASDYLLRPYDPEETTVKLERALERVSLLKENRLLKEQVRLRNGYGRLLGSSPPMRKLFRRIIKVSRADCPVLLMGESGTGKELVARTIHESSPQCDKPFVPIECSAIVPGLFESELFGHVRGAFTGAVRDKQGLLPAAGGGVLFLDEVGELPLEVQAKLLRALQEHEVRPVGSTRGTRFEARIIAATNRDLPAEVSQGRFRDDLFYRLAVVSLRIPPLRERKSDIPLLVEHFLRTFSPSDGVRKAVAQEALDTLIEYDWPGNVRELENTIQRAMALSSGPLIQIADLPTTLQHPASRAVQPAGAHSVVPLRDVEREAILGAVEQCAGDKLRAARMLGIGKTTLYRKLKDYSKG